MTVSTPTREELEAKREAIESAFPALKGLDLSAFCCSGCAYSQVGYEHGWEAADAFEELLDLNYLLIGRRS